MSNVSTDRLRIRGRPLGTKTVSLDQFSENEKTKQLPERVVSFYETSEKTNTAGTRTPLGSMSADYGSTVTVPHTV